MSPEDRRPYPDPTREPETFIAWLCKTKEVLLFAIALRITRHKHDTEDALQETLRKVFERLIARTYVEDGTAIAWVVKILVRCAIDIRKKRGRFRTNLEPAEVERLIGTLGQDLDVSEVIDVVRHVLSERATVTEQKVYQLVVVEGLKYSEAAQKLHITPQGVGPNLTKLRKKSVQGLQRIGFHIVRKRALPKELTDG